MGSLKLLFLFTCLCCNFRTVICTTNSDWKWFFEFIFSQYDRNVFPMLNQSDILQVSLGYSLNAIKGFDEVGGVLQTVGYVEVTWNNQLLVWEKKPQGVSDYIEKTLVPIASMWYPPLTLHNSVTSLKALGEKNEILTVQYDGTTVWKPPVILSSSCGVDSTYFPFDEQTCNMTFTSWDYAAGEIELTAAASTVNFDDYTNNELWTINETSVVAWKDGQASYVTFSLKLKRLPAWFAINILLPLLLLGFLNLFAFLTPLEEGRVGYAMGSFLTYSVFLEVIGANIPAVSSPMSLLSYYVVIQVLISGLTAFLAVFSVRLYCKDPDEPVPKWLSYYIGVVACHVCGKDDDDLDKKKIYPSLSDAASSSIDSGTEMPPLPGTGVVKIEKIQVEELPPLIKFGVPNVKWTPLDAERPVVVTDWCFPQPYVTWLQVAKAVDYHVFIISIGIQIALFSVFILPSILQYSGPIL